VFGSDDILVDEEINRKLSELRLLKMLCC